MISLTRHEKINTISGMSIIFFLGVQSTIRWDSSAFSFMAVSFLVSVLDRLLVFSSNKRILIFFYVRKVTVRLSYHIVQYSCYIVDNKGAHLKFASTCMIVYTICSTTAYDGNWAFILRRRWERRAGAEVEKRRTERHILFPKVALSVTQYGLRMSER